MPSLKDIRLRIDSVKNTQQITRAMKMVSAAKLRRAQDNIVNLRPYASRILNVIADIATTERVEHPLLKVPTDPKSLLLVVVTSDRGLCGSFNNGVNRFAEKFYNDNKGKYDKIDFFFIGRRATEYFRRRAPQPVESLLNLSREISFELSSKIAKRCMEEYINGGYDEVRFIYNEFKSAISQKLVSERLLPVDIEHATLGESAEGSKVPFSRDLLFEPEPALMIQELLEQHFAVQVYRCLAESVAAEHAARMTAMENATKNAKEMISKLTLTYNKLRQASITKELIEICSGAEAVNNA